MLWLRTIGCCWLAASGGAEKPGLAHQAPRSGVWRAQVQTPGGPARFELELAQDAEHGWRAWLINGPERSAVPRVTWDSDTLVLDIDYYDSKITCSISPYVPVCMPPGTKPDGLPQTLLGNWRKNRRGQYVELPFEADIAAPGPVVMEQLVAPPTTGTLAPRWRARFEGAEEDAVSLLDLRPGGLLRGTFLTPTGDYRYLVGHFDGRDLELSCFDGAHAFLFKAQQQPDGSLRGDFWSGAHWHDTWAAWPDPDAQLPDAFAQTTWVAGMSLDALSFPDLDGRRRALSDPQFAGRARIIEVFGTWCPNCRDASRLLVDLDRRYRTSGLSIVALAFEQTGDLARDTAQVRTFALRHEIEYPILIAGEADKRKASEAFPALDRIRSFPTTIFLDRRGEIRAVHTGFAGPATGPAYDALRAEFEKRIEELLSEP